MINVSASIDGIVHPKRLFVTIFGVTMRVSRIQNNTEANLLSLYETFVGLH